MAESSATLQDVIEAISSELELESLLTSIVQKACELLSADRGSIGLVDAARQVVRIEAAYMMPPRELGSETLIGEGLAGRVYQTKAPVIPKRYGDIPNTPLENMDEDAVIGVPIVWRNEVIGTFGIGASAPRVFSSYDADMLALFARHAAIAINNARLYESERKRAARLAAVSDVARVSTENVDVEKMIEIATRATIAHLGFDYADVVLASPNARAGDPAYRYSERTVVRDGEDAIDFEISVPIEAGESIIGMLIVRSSSPPDHDDKIGVETIANQLGVSLRSIRSMIETQEALDEMRLLYETSRRMSMAIDIRGVVDAYLDQVAARQKFVCDVGLIEQSPDGDDAIRIIGRWSPKHGLTHPHHRYRVKDIGLTEILQSDDPVTISNVYTDDRVPQIVRDYQHEQGQPASAVLPLLVRRKPIGIVALAFDRVHDWSEEDLRPHQIAGALLAAIIRSRQQHREILENDRRLAVFRERQRLAHDLHDSVNQLIFSMTLIAQSVGSGFEKGADEGARRVDRLLELSSLVRSEMRAMIGELRPDDSLIEHAEDVASTLAMLRRDGLKTALVEHAKRIAADDISLTMNIETACDRLGGAESEVLFRIVQEALQNVVKHAKATRVEVTLSSAGNLCRLTVEDNGVGIGHAQADDAGAGADSSRNAERHYGLTSMKARAESLGGRLNVRPGKSGGTVVEAEIPHELT